MMHCKAIAFAALVGAATLGGALVATAASAEPRPARECFDSDRVNDWSAAGDQAVYLRVNVADYYRVDLPTPVRELRKRAPNLIIESRDGRVCQPIDLDLGLSVSGMVLPLGVSKIQRLSAEDVALIGAENLPGRHYRRKDLD